MIRNGKLVLFRFPQTDQVSGKIRPALVICRVPGGYNDWLVCMVSTQLSQRIENVDELIAPGDSDFAASGLKEASLLRTTRLAVVNKSIFLGLIGEISSERISRVKTSLSNWIKNA